jgi:hypothetical protein
MSDVARLLGWIIRLVCCPATSPGELLEAQLFEVPPVSGINITPQALPWTLIATRSVHVRAFGGVYSASSWQG